MKEKTHKFKKIIAFTLILMLQLSAVLTAYAQEGETQENDTKVPVQVTQTQKNEQFILQLKNSLQNARNDYFQVSKSIDEAKEKLVEVGDRIDSLKDQLANFDYLISNTQAKIRNVEKQIAQKQNLLENIKLDIDIKKLELENQKLLVKDYLKLIYLQENNYFDSNGDANLSASRILLGDASISDTFKEIEYYSILEQTGQNIFNRLEKAKAEYQLQRTALQQTRQKLTALNTELEGEKKNLKLQKNAKDKLYRVTQGEEEIYRQLIAQSKREQLEIVEEINALKENLLFIEEKIKEEGENFNPDNYQDLINPNVRAVYDFEMLGDFATGEKLNWPVQPTRISAYFRDPSYKAAFGIPHSAIDLPVAQGSDVRAPAAGVVYKVKDNEDESYAYIMLAHKGGLITVYGHMTEILVDERDIVLPGEVIGLSGGIPGTKGAGYLTTGAHLHFEVIKNGKHIDPLFVLDLDKVNPDILPEYMKVLVEEGFDVEEELE